MPNKKINQNHIFFRTCKPTGNPILKFPICLTGQGNKKSIPFIQFEVVECGLDEFCEPYPQSEDILPIEFGYVFLVYNTLFKFCVLIRKSKL